MAQGLADDGGVDSLEMGGSEQPLESGSGPVGASTGSSPSESASAPSLDSGAPSPGGGAPAPGGSAPAPGTRTAAAGGPIEIGIWSLDGAQTTALLSAFGYEGRPFDDHQMIEAVFADMNARGGLLGRRVVPVIYNQEVLDQEGSGQEACAMFTEDHDVVGVGIWSSFQSGSFLECIRQNQLPTSINQAGAVPYFDYEDFNRHPTIQFSDGISWDRQAELVVSQLVATGYFRGWDINTGRPGAAPVRVGVISADTPGARKAISKHLAPALARHGYKIEAQGFSPSTGPFDTTILQFKGQNITHVLPIYNGGTLALYASAESQRYRPRYALDTKAWPFVVTAAATPVDQLRGMVGTGWQPSRDVPGSQWPAPNAQQRRCEQLMAKAGVDTRDQLGRFVSLLICDMAWGLQASFEAGGALTPQAFIEGRRRLGNSFVTATTFKTEFRNGRPDGVAAVRRFAYFEDCDCFRYTSGIIDV